MSSTAGLLVCSFGLVVTNLSTLHNLGYFEKQITFDKWRKPAHHTHDAMNNVSDWQAIMI